MTKVFAAFALLIAFNGQSLSICHADSARKAEVPVRAIRSIQENAVDAGQNAHIYQWMRVNREVDRIVRDARKVSSEDLQEAVRAMRAARLHHDVDGMETSAQKIVDICKDLLANH